MLVALAWLYPTRLRARERTARANARLDAVDRQLGGGNSVLPEQAIAIEARGRIPADGTFAVAVGPRQPGWSVARRPRLARELHAVLPPPPPDRPWRAVDPLLRVRPGGVSPARSAVWEDSTRRLADPEATAVTVRALAGLVGAERRLRGRGPLAALGGSRAFRTWGARRCGSRGSGTSSASPRSACCGRRCSSSACPFGGVGIVVSLVAFSAAAGVVAGRRSQRCTPRARPPPHRRHSGGARDRRAGIALAGLFLEALFRAARLQSLQAYDAWAFWVPKGKAIYFFGGLDEQVFTTTPNASYPPLQPDPRRRGLPRDGRRRTSSRCTCSSGSSSLGAIGGRCRTAPSRHAPPGSSGRPLLLVLVVPRFGERLLAPQARRPPRRPRRRRAHFCSRCGSATRRGWRLAAAAVLLAGRRQHEARGHPLRGVRARRGVRRLAARAAGRGSLAASLAVGARRASLAYLDGRHDIVVAAPPSPFGTGPARGARFASRSTSSTRTRAGRCCPSSATIALVAAAVWGDRRLAAYVGLVAVVLFAGGVWSTVGFPDLAITADESGNPIVRYTGSMVFLAAVAVPLLLASVWRER